jgi:signal peptidase I
VHLHSEHLTTTGSEQREYMGEPPEALQSPLARLWPTLREIIETIVLAAIIWLAVNFATARYVVDGTSMEPTLHTGQFLIVNRLIYRLGFPQRGDIIVFHYPGDPTDDYVKRIIGLPGDHLLIEGGKLYINDVLLDEPYLPENMRTFPRSRYSNVVPEDSYFVLGDNRLGSSDSRNWGMLERELIIGKASFSYWPPQEWGTIPHYNHDTEP